MGNSAPTRNVNYSFTVNRTSLTKGGTTIKTPFFFYNPVNNLVPAYNNEYSVAQWNYPQPWSLSYPSSEFLSVWKSNNNNECGVFYRSNDINNSGLPTVDLTGSKTKGKKVSIQYEFTNGTVGPWVDLTLVRGSGDPEGKWWRADVNASAVPFGQSYNNISKFNFYVEYYV